MLVIEMCDGGEYRTVWYRNTHHHKIHVILLTTFYNARCSSAV